MIKELQNLQFNELGFRLKKSLFKTLLLLLNLTIVFSVSCSSSGTSSGSSSEKTNPNSPPSPSTTSVVLLHFDGTNGSTSIQDVYGNTINVFGSAQISTAESVFGGASLYLDGTSPYDYITVTESIAGDFLLSGDFTIEGFMRPQTDYGESVNIIKSHNVNYGSGHKMWGVFEGNYDKVLYYHYDGSSITYSANTPVVYNAWKHFALVRSGTEIKFYYNGVSSIAPINLSSIFGGNTIMIGYDGGNPHGFRGHLDEIRISKSARYTSDFTPPTSAFTE